MNIYPTVFHNWGTTKAMQGVVAFQKKKALLEESKYKELNREENEKLKRNGQELFTAT